MALVHYPWNWNCDLLFISCAFSNSVVKYLSHPISLPLTSCPVSGSQCLRGYSLTEFHCFISFSISLSSLLLISSFMLFISFFIVFISSFMQLISSLIRFSPYSLWYEMFFLSSIKHFLLSSPMFFMRFSPDSLNSAMLFFSSLIMSFKS